MESKLKSDFKKVTVDQSRFKSYLLDSLWKNFQRTIKIEEKKRLIIQTPHPQISSTVQNPPRAMATRFSPHALPAALHDLPKNYAQRVTLFYEEGNFTTQHHVDRFNDFINLEEVDYDDAKMRLFSQILSREENKLFKYLQERPIPNFDDFQTLFLDRWKD